VADQLWGQWVWNHSAPIVWCAKEVGGHPFGAAWRLLAGQLLGLHGCRCSSRGVWLGLFCINVFGVWVECVKVLLVNVCNGTAKSAEIGSRDTRVSNGQPADIYLFGCVGGVFSGGLFSTQPSQRWLDEVTMRALPDNNADGAEGIIPYIYLDFFRFSFWWEVKSGGGREVVVLGCIISRSV